MSERSDASRHPRLLEHALLVAVLAVALALRVRGLRAWWLNPDEGIYYSTVTRESAGAFWAEVGANAHPPLYYLLLRLVGLFTWDFLWFRMLSLVCGLAAVWAFWRAGRQLGGVVAGLVAALALALSPTAVELSQVMRPYALQLALLASSAWLLLRHLETPRPETLAGYLTVLCLALLTHYSSVLALGVFAALVAHHALGDGKGMPHLRTLVAAHALPAAVVAALYLLHLRPFMDTRLASETLDGWLSFYMVSSPGEAWLGFMGLQSLLAGPHLRGPLAVLLLVALGVSATSADRRPLVLGGAGLLASLAGAATGLYPMGATRHAAWLLAFTVPVLGWLAARIVAQPAPRLVPALAGLALLVGLGDPLGRRLGRDRAPWSPDDRILRWDDLATMTDVLDPQGSPELVLMSAETFYLLVPFYPGEREDASFSGDSTLFRFRFGERTVVATEAWAFARGTEGTSGTLDDVLTRADQAFPEVDLARDSLAVLLVGGWSPPLVHELTEMNETTPFLRGRKDVPGLTALLLDVGRYRHVAAGQERRAATAPTPDERPD